MKNNVGKEMMASKLADNRRRNIKLKIDRMNALKPIKFLLAAVFFVFIILLLPIALVLIPFVLAWDLSTIFLENRNKKSNSPGTNSYEPFVNSRWSNFANKKNVDYEFDSWIQKMEEE